MLKTAVLWLVFATLSQCNTYYIIPTPCWPCPTNHGLTLSEYAQQADRLSAANTTMVFLPGDHFLDTHIVVAHLATFAMLKSPSTRLEKATRIICSQPIGIFYQNTSFVKVDGLQFVSCGRNASIPALLVDTVECFEIHNCIFQNTLGSAVVVEYSSMFLSGVNRFEANNWTCEGGGIRCFRSNLTLTGNNSFVNNKATRGGGIFGNNCTVDISGFSYFMNNNVSSDRGFSTNCRSTSSLTSSNRHRRGGGIFANNCKVSITGLSYFYNNSGKVGGGISMCRSTLNSAGKILFEGNLVTRYGGGIFTVHNCSININGSTQFIHNIAQQGGGGIAMQFRSEATFTGHTNFRSNSARFGGGLSTVKSSVKFIGSSLFVNNTGKYGGSVSTKQGNLKFIGSNNFVRNNAIKLGGVMRAEYSNISFSKNGSFFMNSARNGGAIYATKSNNIYFSGYSNFSENFASTLGGALLLRKGSKCYFSSTAVTYFIGNHAEQDGGAIYVDDQHPFDYCYKGRVSLVLERLDECFFQIPDQNLSQSFNSQMIFKNNSAEKGGVLFGGLVDHCRLIGTSISSGRAFDHLFGVNRKNKTLQLDITSTPLKVRLCIKSQSSYNSETRTVVHTYPGKTFYVSVVAVGQRNGVVPAVIRAHISEKHGYYMDKKLRNANLFVTEGAQSVKNTCTTLNYTVFSLAHSEQLQLYTEGPCSSTFVRTVYVKFHSCPTGFTLSRSRMACACNSRLSKYTNSCDINDESIQRDGEFWVGYDNHTKGLIFHPHCAFDYCKLESIKFILNDTDLQCEYNRSGLLCGACKKGFSLALGSSKCMQCSNTFNYLWLLIVFALAGIALVVFLLVCRITVAAGTINGLIFYANIVIANRATFFPLGVTNILTVFISWLNLDVGIELCFYSGMDEYARTWLQFVFPLYIWTLVGMIIILSYYSSRISRVFGTNPVSVLSTLFLLSYTKIIRTIIAAFYFTVLEYPNGSKLVWLYDGNITYLHGKHIPLFVTALVMLLFLFLPYTVILILGQWFQAKSNKRAFSWINNVHIKPFIDAYHAPYKNKHRYWPGMMLCVRCLHLFVFAFNALGDSSVNLLVISITMFVLTGMTKFTGRIYKTWYLDAIELSFILNLGIVSAATLYIRSGTNGENESGRNNHTAVVYSSVGTAFITFIAIIIFHTYKQLKSSEKLKQILHHLPCQRIKRDTKVEQNEDVTFDSGAQAIVAPTSTYIELREPLLEQ